ncbi:hypothetical protein Prudu_020142 [Prunus dulcis]|uniref:SKP1 component dimerisation domain-containing protein n=1 Tax=Prunus dulcis TaxID=3755 RepID=A0A4Y1RWD8_PRUDU|nr:hypothetical protein Prudu_020142 [Prunus dulcis]
MMAFDLGAANFLNIKSLLDLTCQRIADMIKGKTPAEIRKTFNIKDQFTPEEEEEVRRENHMDFRQQSQRAAASVGSRQKTVRGEKGVQLRKENPTGTGLKDGIPCLLPKDGKTLEADDTLKPEDAVKSSVEHEADQGGTCVERLGLSVV